MCLYNSVMNMNRRAYLTGVTGGVVTMAGCLSGSATEQADPDLVAGWADGTIEFALPPFQDAAELERQYAGLFGWLEDGFDGVRVEGQETTSYASAIESVVAGHSELANLSPLIYVMAADEGITPLAVNELYGESSYHSYVVTRTETDIETVSDLEGKTVAMVELLSASGGLFPMDVLAEAGLDVGDVDHEATDVEIDWAGSHDAALRVLEEGHVDAAAYGDFEHPDPDETDADLEIVAESEPIPLAAAVTTPETPDSVVEALRDRLLETPEDTLSEHMVSGFAEYDPDEYEVVREIATQFGVTVSELDEAA